MDKIYNKPEFVRRMAKKGYTLKACTQVVDDMLDTIIDILVEGDGVKFKGFGSFDVRERGARTSVSPTTKEKIIVPARNCVHFTVGTYLKNSVKDGQRAE